MVKITKPQDLIKHLNKLPFDEINKIYKNLDSCLINGGKPNSPQIKAQYKYAEDLINKKINEKANKKNVEVVEELTQDITEEIIEEK